MNFNQSNVMNWYRIMDISVNSFKANWMLNQIEGKQSEYECWM